MWNIFHVSFCYMGYDAAVPENKNESGKLLIATFFCIIKIKIQMDMETYLGGNLELMKKLLGENFMKFIWTLEDFLVFLDPQEGLSDKICELKKKIIKKVLHSMLGDSTLGYFGQFSGI